MPRRHPDEVVVDPVAAGIRMLLDQDSGAIPEPDIPHGRTPWADPGHDVLGDIQESKLTAERHAHNECALGHVNVYGARFCASCGLSMDAEAPGPRVDARPKPAAELSAAERAERDRQHAEALKLARQVDAAKDVYAPVTGEAVTIHFIEDGFTFAGRVWMRGQEIRIGPSHPRWPQARQWITMSRYQQIDRYGKHFFEPGPWPGRKSYLDGADSFEQLGTLDKSGTFAGPGEDALRQADEAERRRGGAVPMPLFGGR